MPRTPSGHPELLDRERELADVASGLESATAGSGRILVVEGPSGIGKTELLRRAVELARQTGFTALSATAAEVERDVPYGVVRQLFERSIAKAPAEERSDLFSGAAALATVVLEAGTSTTEAGRDGTPDPVRGSQAPGNRPAGPADLATVDRSFRVDHGLYWLCANMTARAPVLLAVDDGHWVDAESTRFLLYLARRIEELPIFFLASVRPEEEGSRPLDELASLPVATVVRPRPLSEGGVARVTRAALGDRADDVFCSACHAATGGNPFLLHAVLRALAEKGVEPFAAAAATVANVSATAVSRWMVARIERLSPQAPALARAAAVLGPDALLRQAAALAFLDERQAAEVTDQLVAAGILRAGRPLDFEHPVVRAAVYDAMPSAERGDAHKRAARVLALEGASPHRVAAHLLACEPSGDRWTVEILRSAATHALERGAPESATRYLRRALDEPPAQSDRADVLKELGAAELRVDAAMAAEHLRMALGVSEEPVQRALICLPLLDAFAWAGRVEEMLDPVSATIDAVHDRDPDLALELEAKLVTALRTGVATSPLADRRLDRWQGRVEGRSRGERALLVHLAVRSAVCGGDADAMASLAERAIVGGRLLAEHPESMLPYLPLYQLMCADRHLDLVADCLSMALAHTREIGSRIGFGYASVFRSYLSRVQGQLADAEADALQGLRVARDFPGFRFPLAGVLDALVTVLLERGKFGEAEAALTEHHLAGDLPESVTSRVLLASRGHLRLAEGRLDEASADLLELLDREERRGPANLFLDPYRSLAALVLARLGQKDRAIALADDGVARARAWRAAPALSTALRRAGLVRGGHAGLELLAEAVAVLEGSSAALARAWALTDLGSALRRAGRRSEALRALREGLDLAHRCGADPLAVRARQELVVAGARPRRPALTGVESLTPSERRVCQLAAEGMTNAEIAQALFVTVRTVEHHLTHAYQAGDHLPGVARTRSGRNWHQQAPFSSLSRPSLGGSVPAAGTSQTRPARRRRVKAGISDLGRSAASA